jgi:hypothetical protein
MSLSKYTLSTKLTFPLFFKSQPEKVICAIQKMNSKKVSKLLLDKFDYQSMPKAEFIQKLEMAFQQFKQGGDTFLKLEEGKCTSSLCSRMVSFSKCDDQLLKLAYSFIGNKTQSHMDLIIEVCGPLFQKPKYIIEIHECSSLKLVNDSIVLGKSIEISPSN